MNVLIAAVGYISLRDLSFGPELLPRLREMAWPPWVEIDDWSFGPIAVVQRLQDHPGHYGRIVFVSATERGREPGRVYRYRWHPQPLDDEQVQERVAEAVTGVISLDNLLIVAHHFGVLPEEVVVVEVEPMDDGWGPGFSPEVESTVDGAIELIRKSVAEGYDG